MDEEILQQLEQIIGYSFSDRTLLARALTHSSAANNRLSSNERMEFLGDAILAIVICQSLFERFVDYLEGDLTQIKSMLVSRETCARLSRQMGLEKYLKVGKSMIASRSLSGSLAAGALEAIVAAIYLDGGFEAARSFILRLFDPLIERANKEQAHGNYKSLLQQYAQDELNAVPAYAMVDEKGPDHNKCFELEVVIGDRRFPSAWGTNKKEAEQKAAFNALVELGVLKNTAFEEERL
jgi:ribonuclease-3